MIYHCTMCHHEWQYRDAEKYGAYSDRDPMLPVSTICDWCGAPGKKIADVEGGDCWVRVLKNAIRGALIEWYSERGEGVSGTELDKVSNKILNALQEVVKDGGEEEVGQAD